MPFTELSGKTALITGASSGLGVHFAHLLASCGVSVFLAARRIDTVEAVSADICKNGGVARAVHMDVTQQSSVDKALTEIEGRIDVLINNAGVAANYRASNLSEVNLDAVLDTNLKGTFLVAQAVARRMKSANHGAAIVNVASILGLRVAGNVCVYAASKAGVIQLTKALALEWARDGIRVNALCPGYIETDINQNFFASKAGLALIRRIPQRRLGKPEDLDGALLLLCSDASRYITGISLAVDGGHLVSSL